MASLLVLLFPLSLYAQTPNFDNLIKTRYIPCNDVSQSAGEILTNFYRQQKEDSMLLFINYWEKKCQENRSTLAIKTCLAIKNNSLDTSSIDSSFYARLKNRRIYYRYPHSWTFYPNENHLIDSLISNIISDVPRPNLSQDEKFLLEYFQSSYSSIDKLEKEQYESSKLFELHKKERERIEDLPESRITFGFGTFIPQGDLSFINVKPSIYLLFGRRIKRHHIDVALGVAFGGTKDSFLINYNNAIVPTTDFTQIYLGAEYGFDFIQKENIAVQALGGIGFNQASLLSGDNDYGENGYIKKSLNLSTGLGFEFKRRHGYYGLQLRYNAINYKTKIGETSLNGNFMSVRLLFGIRHPSMGAQYLHLR